MDSIDRQILEFLQENAKIANSEIAKRLNMAPSAILERVRKLEKKNILTGYTARINPEAVDLDLLAFVMMSVEVANWSDQIGPELSKIPWVQEVHEIAGHYSYLIKIRATSTSHLSEILKQEVGKITKISQTQSILVLNTVKEEIKLPTLSGF